MGGGGGAFGSVGGVSDPALGQPQSPPLDPFNLPAGSAGPMMGMNAPTPTQGSNALGGLGGFATKFGKTMNAITPLINASRGIGQRTPGGPPVNFSMPNQVAIAAPPMQGNPYAQNNPYGMSNAFYGG